MFLRFWKPLRFSDLRLLAVSCRRFFVGFRVSTASGVSKVSRV